MQAIDQTHRAPRVAAACALLVGSLAGFGWMLDVPSLQRLGPGAITIKPWSVVGFLLLGSALWLLAIPRRGEGHPRGVAWLGAGTAGLGLSMVAEYLFHGGSRFDTLLMGHAVMAEAVKFPGRMTASTAITFILLGSSVVLATVAPGRVRAQQGFALAAGFLALFALIAYTFDAVVEQPWMGDFTPLTPAMAVVCIGLSLGLALLRPDAGVMGYVTAPGPGGTMARVLLPVAVVMPVLLSWAQLVALRRRWESVEMIITIRALVIVLVLVGFIWLAARATFRQGESRIRLLEESAARLLEANVELDGFARSVSHDLRAPVRAVDGFAQLLEESHAGQLDAEGRRLLGLVRQSSLQMGHLIDDLLAFSRMSRQTRDPVRVPMQDLARVVAAEACAAEPARSIAVDVGPLPDIEGDRSMLRQVWMNLLSNAVKYTRGRPAPGIRVTGEVCDGFARYAVADNGAGFDARYGDKLFGVFQRLHSAEEYEGSGVGLALVKRIIERHGGSVGAEGRPGHGATFRFSLPVVPLSGSSA